MESDQTQKENALVLQKNKASEMENKKKISISDSFSMMPQNLGELMTFANMLAESELVPKDYKGKPGNIMVAMQMGSEIGILPMQAIQNIAVINGKPAIYGDLGKALLRNKGCDIEEADIEIIRKTGRAWCRIVRHGQKSVERTFSIEDAKTAKLWDKDGVWKTYPYRQMAWRAFWFAARDAAPDILKGLVGREEAEDFDFNKTPAPDFSLSEIMPQSQSEVDATNNNFSDNSQQTKTDNNHSTSPIHEGEISPSVTTLADPEAQVTSESLAKILDVFQQVGMTKDKFNPYLNSMIGVKSINELKEKDSARVIAWLKNQSKK